MKARMIECRNCIVLQTLIWRHMLDGQGNKLADGVSVWDSNISEQEMSMCCVQAEG